jgi:hypothetical protein
MFSEPENGMGIFLKMNVNRDINTTVSIGALEFSKVPSVILKCASGVFRRQFLFRQDGGALFTSALDNAPDFDAKHRATEQSGR